MNTSSDDDIRAIRRKERRRVMGDRGGERIREDRIIEKIA